MASNRGQKPMLVKVIMLGNGGVGKSSLTLQFNYGEFPEIYEPTKCGSYKKTVLLDDRELNLDIMDTAGQEEYANVRDSYLRAGDGFLCVFSLTDRSTFANTEEIREQILRINSERDDISILLIGNKADLEDRREISEEEGLEQARKWGCKYLETSAKTNFNVENAFHEIMRQVYQKKETAVEATEPKARSEKDQKTSNCACF